MPLDRLEAGLVAQRIHERVGLEQHQSRITQTHRRGEPFKRLGPITPLCIDRGVLISAGIAGLCPVLREYSLHIGVLSHLVVHHGQAPLGFPVLRLALA